MFGDTARAVSQRPSILLCVAKFFTAYKLDSRRKSQRLKVAATDFLKLGLGSYTTNFSCILPVRDKRFKRRGKRLHLSMEEVVKKLHISLFHHSNQDQVEGV